jgi:hypothetical protein
LAQPALISSALQTLTKLAISLQPFSVAQNIPFNIRTQRSDSSTELLQKG